MKYFSLNKIYAEKKIQDLQITYSSGQFRYSPGDRRRFLAFAKQKKLKVKFLNKNYNREKTQDKTNIFVYTHSSDLTDIEYKKNIYYVFDFVDSYLHVPKTSLKGILRGAAKYLFGVDKKLKLNYWKTISNACKRADLVICSTNSQKKEIIKYNSNVETVLDLNDNYKNQKKNNYSIDEKKIYLCWEGQPENLSQLEIISDVLIELKKKYPIELKIITDLSYYNFLKSFIKRKTENKVNSIFKNDLSFVKLIKWKKNNYFKHIISSDIAIIPINLNDKFTAEKPENKLLHIWKLRVPAIVSATRAYKKTMKNCGLDDYVVTKKDWYVCIEKLILSEENRKKNAFRGFDYANKNFNNKVLINKWNNIFNIKKIKYRILSK